MEISGALEISGVFLEISSALEISCNNICIPGNLNMTGGKTQYLCKFLDDGILTQALYCRIMVETRNLSLYQMGLA